MNIRRKVFSIGTSAALLASLLTAVAAPTAFGALGTSGGGNITPGGAASAAGTLTFAEDTVAQYASGSFTVAVLGHDGTDGDVTFSTSSSPSVTRNAGVGACSAGFVADTLVVTCTGFDATKIDSFTIGNLKVAAGAGAEMGAVIFDVTADTIGLQDSLGTATGTVGVGFTGSGVSQAITTTLDAGSPPYAVTGTDCSPASLGAVGKVNVAVSGVSPAESVTATATNGSTSITGIFTQSKPAGTAITQTVCVDWFPSFATVGDAVDVTVPGGAENMQAGVNSQDGGNINVQLGFFDDLLLSGDTVTFTIQTTGVLFSPNSCVISCAGGSGIGIGTPTLSADRKSVTVGITSDADAGDDVTFDPDYDVALGVATGTTVDVAVTVSRAGVTVLGSPATVGVVGFVVAGSTAAPNVFIGQNDQSTGMITLVESAAGAIPEDTIEVCLESDDESWSTGRYFWAVVTAGDLKLNVAGLPAAQGKMTIDGDCLEILVYTSSTAASTIEIRNGSSTAPDASGATNGPKVNVDLNSEPGAVYVDVYVDSTQVADNIVIAVRAYTGTPVVAASAQLNVNRGGIAQLVGNITITEGAPNQFESLSEFQVCIVDPSGSFTGAYGFTTPVGANAPVVTTNSIVSGLIAFYDASDPDVPGCLDFNIDDTSLTGLGSMTISNLKIDVKADAPLGSVFVRVFDGSSEGDPELVNQIVSPARVVDQREFPLTNASALGVTTVGPFTASTKVQALSKYITWKISGGSAVASKKIEVWIATKSSTGVWSAFTKLTTRWADSAGNAYFNWRSSAAKWISIRAYFPGDLTTAATWSAARQGRWR